MNSINGLKSKNKVEFQKNNIKKGKNIRNKSNNKESPKIFPSNKGKITKLDRQNYNKALLYKCNPKKSESMKDYLKLNNFKNKSKSKPLGPYGHLFNGGGGFCRRVGNNYKQNLYLYHPHSYHDNVNNNSTNKNISRNDLLKYQNKSYNNFIIKPKNKISNNNSKKNFILINNNNNKINYKKRIINKVNINEVNKNINYLKLNNKNINDDEPLKEKENIKKIDMENDHMNNKDENIYDNVKNKSNEYQDITDPKKKIVKSNSTKDFIKQTNEQFSMKNSKIKKFNKLTEVDSVLLNYFPSFNVKAKHSIANFTISSSQIEYTIINKPNNETNIEEDNTKFTKNINDKDKSYIDLNIPEKYNNTMNLEQNEEIDKNRNDNIKKKNKIINKEKILNEINSKNKEDDKSMLDKAIISNNINNLNNTNKNNNDDTFNEKKIINGNVNNNNMNNSNINYNNIKESDIKNREENDDIIEKEKNNKSKNSKQFMKFRTKIMERSASEPKKNEEKYNISTKIKNMASDLENKFKKIKICKI